MSGARTPGAERHWLHVFSTFDAGGPQVRTVEILARLPSGYRHTVMAMDGRTGCLARVPPSVRVEVVPPPGERGPVAVSAAVAALLRRLRPDLLLTYNFGAVEALLGAWRAGYRAVVHHEEGFGDDEIERRLPRRNWLRRVLLRRARAVVVPSRVLERIARSVWWVPERRLHYLPNGVDVQRFRPRPERGSAHEERLRVGCVAAFRPVKNQPLLLQAWARSELRRGAELVLVGDGPERAACEVLVASLGVGDSVRFAGASSDTAAVLPTFDVFAASSRTEQMPIAVLEAMACALPVVHTDVGDVCSMVAEENRPWIVPRDDAAALAVALDRVGEDAARRAAVGRANRARCERHFEIEQCLQRYVELFERVASGR